MYCYANVCQKLRVVVDITLLTSDTVGHKGPNLTLDLVTGHSYDNANITFYTIFKYSTGIGQLYPGSGLFVWEIIWSKTKSCLLHVNIVNINVQRLPDSSRPTLVVFVIFAK